MMSGCKNARRNVLLIVCILLAVIAVIEMAVLVYRYKNAACAPPAIITGVDSQANEVESGSSDFVQILDMRAAERMDAESQAVQEYAEELARTEDGRREQARLKQEAEQKLRQDYIDLLKAQAELQAQLDARAEAEIAMLGGKDATKSDHVIMITQPPVQIEETPSITLPIPSVPSDNSGYLGQFSAEIVCTCASCFNVSEHPGTAVDEQYIVADPEYIATGTTVRLNQGLSGDFPVGDGTGIVSGRSIIIYSPNHTETQGGQKLYPKIYESEE